MNTEERLDAFEEQLNKLANCVNSSYIAFRDIVPLTDYEVTPLKDWPEYTKQQLWFFEREIRRWQISNARRPGFAICSFLPGVPLHPLVFLPINTVIEILNTMMKQANEHTSLLQQIEQAKRDLAQLKNSQDLIDLPSEPKQLGENKQ